VAAGTIGYSPVKELCGGEPVTVLDPNLAAGPPATGMPRPRTRGVRVEPMVGLEWSDAIEAMNTVHIAASPADHRRAWIHRAEEQQVLALFRAVHTVEQNPPSPWWLRAVHRGKLPSRAAGFAVEDEVTELLSARPGWVYVPWASEGEVGYWEFVPSESGVYGPAEPTTVQFTDLHPGWVDLLPAHRGPGLQQAIPFTAADLRAQIEDLENIA
jgi:hypothetical protein